LLPALEGHGEPPHSKEGAKEEGVAMDPNTVTPELALRGNEALTYICAWTFAVLAWLATVGYLLFLWFECFSSAARGERRDLTARKLFASGGPRDAGSPLLRPRVRLRLPLRVMIRFAPARPAARAEPRSPMDERHELEKPA